jgi:hypothetical protein
MQLALPDLQAPAILAFGNGQRMADDQYVAFCLANPDLRIERTVRGGNGRLDRQPSNWAG